MEHISYKKQTEIVNFQGREIPLENLTPSSPRSRRRQSAGNWSSGFMRCSASTPATGRRRNRPAKFSPRRCFAGLAIHEWWAFLAGW